MNLKPIYQDIIDLVNPSGLLKVTTPTKQTTIDDKFFISNRVNHCTNQ
jgi:hypothetical protein